MVLQQEQYLLPDISPASSIYIIYGIVNNSSEDARHNCLGCFLCYFTNLSKVHNFFI